MKCEKCNGTGKIETVEMPLIIIHTKKCKKCNGTGKLDKCPPNCAGITIETIERWKSLTDEHMHCDTSSARAYEAIEQVTQEFNEILRQNRIEKKLRKVVK